jgi:hypothetical protein
MPGLVRWLRKELLFLLIYIELWALYHRAAAGWTKVAILASGVVIGAHIYECVQLRRREPKRDAYGNLVEPCGDQPSAPEDAQ